MSASTELTRSILDHVIQPMIVISPDGVIAYANEATRQALRFLSDDGLVGRPSHAALHEFHADGTRYPAEDCPIIQSEAAHAASVGHEIFLDRLGDPVSVSWAVSPVPHASYRLLTFTPETFAQHRPRVTVNTIRLQIENGYSDPGLTPLSLAQANNMSLRTLQVLLARHNLAPASMIRERRLANASQLLGQGAQSSSAALHSGFSDPDTFSRAFRRYYGCAPSRFRALSERPTS